MTSVLVRVVSGRLHLAMGLQGRDKGEAHIPFKLEVENMMLLGMESARPPTTTSRLYPSAN
jgi:hypothetical protein